MSQSKVKSISAVVIIFIIGIAGFMLLSNTGAETQKRDIKPQVRIVNTQKLIFGDLNLTVSGNGIIKSQSSLSVVSEVSGRIDYAKNNLKDGTFVEKDEVVLKVDSREMENNLYSSRSQFINTIALMLPYLKSENPVHYKKWSEYFSTLDIKKNLPELPEISDNLEKTKLSSRQIFIKYYDVRNQEILLSKYTIKAPFSGYLKSNGVIEKSFISRGQHLFDIDDVYNLEIAIPLLVSDFNKIEFSQAAVVEIGSDNTDKTISGKLVRRNPKLDKNSQSIHVFVEFTNYKMVPEFLAGNYVNIRINGKLLKDVAEIGRHLVDNENNIYTLIDGKLAKEKVKVVAFQDNSVVIANTFEKDVELVSTILQKPLIGMLIKSSSNVETGNSSESITL